MRSEAFNSQLRAISVDPTYYKSYYNLADLYLVSDQPARALPLLQSAIRLNPNFTEAYVSLGAALMRGGQFRETTIFLEQNIDRIGENAEAHFYLGSAYAFLGNREAAIRELEVVSRFDANLAATLSSLLGLNSNHGFSHGRK
jgi:tetratricopeptide (TPR) repeat protein